MSALPPQQPGVASGSEPADRLEELIALETMGLAEPAEMQELAALSQSRRDARRLRRQVTAAATAVTLAATGADAVSKDLRSRLIRSGIAELASVGVRAEPTRKVGEATRRTGWWAWAGYVAAACLAVAVLMRPSGTGSNLPSPEAMLAEPGTVRIAWSPTDASSGMGGEVVWSEKYQGGYMRLANVPPNRPDVSQYQLWIFDEARPEATPVDGGVFDVPTKGEVVVPIRPALKVSKATLFAVTEEPPGGVVVSDRSRLHLLAVRK